MNYGVWIDTTSARIVQWDGQQASLKTIHSGITRKAKWEGETTKKVKRGKGFDYESKQQHHFQSELNKFLKVISEEIRAGDFLYIIGPSQTKFLLENMILKEPRLMPRIEKVESCSDLTDHQLISRVSKYFRAKSVEQHEFKSR